MTIKCIYCGTETNDIKVAHCLSCGAPLITPVDKRNNETKKIPLGKWIGSFSDPIGQVLWIISGFGVLLFICSLNSIFILLVMLAPLGIFCASDPNDSDHFPDCPGDL